MTEVLQIAPEWQVQQWFNTKRPLSLAKLRGQVVVMHAFQMLCPGCVSHGLPQAQRIAATFNNSDVAVIGLHCVFEHHTAMTPVSLQAFLHEYRIDFPVAVDQPSKSSAVPQTMATYGLQGTPSLLLFDRAGVLRWKNFGRPDDMQVGAKIMALVLEAQGGSDDSAKLGTEISGTCTSDGCSV